MRKLKIHYTTVLTQAKSLRPYVDLPRYKSLEMQALKPFAVWLVSQGYDVANLKGMSAGELEDLMKRYENEQN